MRRTCDDDGVSTSLLPWLKRMIWHCFLSPDMLASVCVALLSCTVRDVRASITRECESSRALCSQIHWLQRSMLSPPA
jgi:hypothetical protein